MPRALTIKEIEYIAKLVVRNSELIEKKVPHADAEKIWKEGLKKPMPPQERMMRKRIREKAREMLMDLVAIEAAGIWPDRKDLAIIDKAYILPIKGKSETLTDAVDKMRYIFFSEIFKGKTPLERELMVFRRNPKIPTF